MKNAQRGFSLVELMVTVAILSFLIAAVMMTFGTGQNSWLTTDAQIQVQENLRQSVERISKELRETGKDLNGVIKLSINDGAGVNGSDILQFSVPIICEAGGSVMDDNGDVAHWGAPLTWGCTDSNCMDADDDCSTLDYSAIVYLIDANNRLLRRVLNGASAVVREDIFAQNITDLQASLSADQNILTLIVTLLKKSDANRPVTAVSSNQIYLRNRG